MPLRLGLLLLTALFAWRCWYRRCELGARPVTLIWDADNRWWWKQNTEEIELVLCGDSYHSTAMVILNLRRVEGGERRSVVLLPVSVEDEVFRRLCVRLRLEGAHAAGGGQGHPALFKSK